MNNKAAISRAADLARSANRLSMYHVWTGHPERATYWLDRRATHMATARQLKQDATAVQAEIQRRLNILTPA